MSATKLVMWSLESLDVMTTFMNLEVEGGEIVGAGHVIGCGKIRDNHDPLELAEGC